MKVEVQGDFDLIFYFYKYAIVLKKKKKPALKNVRYIFYRWCIFTHTQTAHKS